MDPIQLSKNFFLDEFTRSQTAARHGIDMTVEPGSEIHLNLQRLCVNVLQLTREEFGPLVISSGYRPEELNRLIGGSPTSQHRFGLAADFHSNHYTPLFICEWIAENLPFKFDQLIHEFGQWVHVSVPAAGATPRNEKLTAFKKDSRTVYVSGLHSIESLEG